MPPHAPLVESVRRQTELRHTCALCGVTFRGAQVGMLACAYHPLAYLQERTPLADAVERAAPTGCVVCKRACVCTGHPGAERPERADADPFASCRPAQAYAEDGLARRGCTRIDHTTDVVGLLWKPYVVLPDFLWPFFDLASATTLPTHRRDRLDERHGSVVACISTPAELRAQPKLLFTVPNARAPIELDTVALYNECAQLYGYEQWKGNAFEASLADQRARTKLSMLSTDAGMRRNALYDVDAGTRRFVPFAVVRRVAATPGIEAVAEPVPMPMPAKNSWAPPAERSDSRRLPAEWRSVK